MTNGSTPAGWYQDPTGQGESRFWNGSSWTQSVNQGGTTVNVPIDPAQATQPPVPGTQTAAPAQPTTVVQQSSSHSALGTIIGVVVALFAVVVILAVIGNATSDDSPTPGSDPAPAEQPAEEAPPAEQTSEGG